MKNGLLDYSDWTRFYRKTSGHWKDHTHFFGNRLKQFMDSGLDCEHCGLLLTYITALVFSQCCVINAELLVSLSKSGIGVLWVEKRLFT